MRRPAPSLPLSVIGLLIAAAVLRLVHLGRLPLYLDEAVTWAHATLPAWIDTVRAEPNHPPLWRLLTRSTIALLGDGEAALRLPAALLGIAAVGLTWALARRLVPGAPRGTALLATALAALGGFWIEYAQEARMYSALLVESLLLSLLFLRYLEGGRRRDAIAYAGVATLALFTHLFAIWPLLAHAVCAAGLALRGHPGATPRRVAGLAAAQAMAAGLALLWFLPALSHGAGVTVGGRFDALSRMVYSLWRIAVGPGLAALDRPRVDAGLAAFVRAEAPAIVGSGIVWGAALGLGAWRLVRIGTAGWFVASGLVVPLLGLLAIQSRLPLMHEKYLVFLAPLVVVVAALGARGAPGALRPLLTAGLLAVSALGTAAWLAPDAPLLDRAIVHGHPAGREQWREVQAWVAERAGPGTRVVLHPAYIETPFRYYDRGRHETTGAPEAPADPAALEHAVPGWTNAPRVLWIFSHDRDADRERFLAVIARATGTSADTLLARVRLFPRQWGIRVLETSPSRPGG